MERREKNQKQLTEADLFPAGEGHATLTIPVKKYRGDSMVISSRLTAEMVAELDEIAEKTGRTRNEIVQTCLEFALDNLKIR